MILLPTMCLFSLIQVVMLMLALSQSCPVVTFCYPAVKCKKIQSNNHEERLIVNLNIDVTVYWSMHPND